MSYQRYEDLGEYNTVDVNISKIYSIRPEYWDNPLRNRIETVHLNGIFPQREKEKVLLTHVNKNGIIWQTACDLNRISETRKYWKRR